MINIFFVCPFILAVDWLLTIDYPKVCIHVAKMPRVHMTNDSESARIGSSYRRAPNWTDALDLVMLGLMR